MYPFSYTRTPTNPIHPYIYPSTHTPIHASALYIPKPQFPPRQPNTQNPLTHLTCAYHAYHSPLSYPIHSSGTRAYAIPIIITVYYFLYISRSICLFLCLYQPVCEIRIWQVMTVYWTEWSEGILPGGSNVRLWKWEDLLYREIDELGFGMVMLYFCSVMTR